MFGEAIGKVLEDPTGIISTSISKRFRKLWYRLHEVMLILFYSHSRRAWGVTPSERAADKNAISVVVLV